MADVTWETMFAFDGILLLVISLPLVAAAALGLGVSRGMARTAGVWSPLAAVAAAVALEPGHLEHFDWLLLGTLLELDEVGRFFLFFTGLLWWLAGLVPVEEAGDPVRRTRFEIFWLLTMSGNLGVTLARDLPSFLFFFSLLSLSSYGLVVHRGDQAAVRAGRIYLILLVLAEAALYAAAVLVTRDSVNYGFDSIRIALANSPRQWLISALFLVGFGVKAGFILLHVSLPPAYEAAPAKVGAVLSGAASKVGVLGWILVLPVGLVARPALGLVFLVGGLVGTYYGVVVGLLQRSPKAMLAYSSISQLGFMILLIGVGLRSPELWEVALAATALYALHHGLNKGALFAGLAVCSTHRPARHLRWLVFAGLCVPALALAGAPWTSGAMAKLALKASLDAEALQLPVWFESSVLYAAVGTALLMARFLGAVWVRYLDFEPSASQTAGPRSWAPWALMVLSVLVVPWLFWWDALRPALGQVWGWHAVWSALWPLLVAALVVAATLVGRHRLGRLTRLRLPPGDILVPAERIVGWMRAKVRRGADWSRTCWRRIDRGLERAISYRRWLVDRVGASEDVLRAWHVGAACLVLLAALMVTLLFLG